MNLENIYKGKAEVSRREIAGESFLIPICGTPVDMENIFVLSPVGDFIWQRLDGSKPLAHIISEIIAEFDVTKNQAQRDAGDFVRKLLANHLAEKV